MVRQNPEFPHFIWERKYNRMKHLLVLAAEESINYSIGILWQWAELDNLFLRALFLNCQVVLDNEVKCGGWQTEFSELDVSTSVDKSTATLSSCNCKHAWTNTYHIKYVYIIEYRPHNKCINNILESRQFHNNSSKSIFNQFWLYKVS